MAQLAAVGANSQVTYVQETTFGTIPTSPTMKILRAKIGSKFELKRNTFTSKELSSTRQVQALIYGNRSGSGDIPIELSYGSYDDLLEAVMGGTWATNVLKIGNTKRSFTMEMQYADIGLSVLNTGVVLTGFSLGVKPDATVEGSFTHLFKDQSITQTVYDATATGNITFTATTVTRASGSFVTDGYANGDIVQIANANTAANNKVATIVTVAATTLTFAAATFTVDATNNANVSVSKTLSLSPSVVTTNTPFDSFTGLIQVDGVTTAIATSIDIKLDQGGDTSNVLFDPTIQQVSLGTVNVTGTVTARFINNALKAKFIAGTAVDLSFTLGVTSKTYKFDMSTVKFTGASESTDEKELTVSLPFTATYNSGDASTLMITRTP